MAGKTSQTTKQHTKVDQVENAEDKDILTQEDIQNGIRTFGTQDEPHPALETPDGKNIGAIPAAYEGQQSNHP